MQEQEKVIKKMSDKTKIWLTSIAIGIAVISFFVMGSAIFGLSDFKQLPVSAVVEAKIM